MPKWYIYHEDLDVPENGIAYFGPWEESELTERLNDPVAEMFAGSGNVDAIQLSDEEAGYVNSREWWFKSLAEIQAFSAPKPQ